MTELKPCPFCGEHAETDFIPDHGSYRIECSVLNCATGPIRDSEAEAIRDWNDRATPAPAQPEEESLEWKFSCVIDHATGGKLSKPGWALATIKSAIDEHVNETHKSWDEAEAGSAAPAEGEAK